MRWGLFLNEMGLEDKVNPKWGEVWREYENPLDFLSEYHAGSTRGQIRRDDQGFYQRLRKDNLLGHVPTGDRSRPQKHGVDPLAYYHEHHAGLTRGELAIVVPGLYQHLWRDGLLGSIPTKSSRFGVDPLAYYETHYPGLTRGQIRYKDQSLYQRLRKDGLLEHIPLKPLKPR